MHLLNALLGLIRWKNLVMIAAIQCIVRFAIIIPFKADNSLSNLSFFAVIMATCCIAAAGYIINDIFDVSADKVNKPQLVYINKIIPENTAYNLYFICNSVGVILGFVVANQVNKPGLTTVLIGAALVNYVYTTTLKKYILIGNFAVAFLVSLALLIVPLFELYPSLDTTNKSLHLLLFNVIFDYAVFAFLMTLIRELIKDLQDIKGDQMVGLKTTPVVLGVFNTKIIVTVFTIITVIGLGHYTYNYVYNYNVAVLYFLLTLLGPLFVFLILLIKANTSEEFSKLSKILKLIMIFGMLSLILYPFLIL